MVGIEAVVIPLASTLLGGGLILGLLRLRPEAGSLVAQASESAIRNLLASMTDLESRLEAAARQEECLRQEIASLRGQLASMRVSLQRVHEIEVERDGWRARARLWERRAREQGWTEMGTDAGPGTDAHTNTN
jgi:uncharacterized protein YhaN